MKPSSVRLTVLIVLFAALIGFLPSSKAHAASLCLSGRGTTSFTSPFVQLDAGDTITGRVKGDNATDLVDVAIDTAIGASNTGVGVGSASANLTVPAATEALVYFDDFGTGGPIGSSFTWSLSINNGCSTGPGAVFTDGRLNSADAAQTAAIYCDKGSVVVYYIGNPWQLALKVTTAEIDRVPSLPDKNTLIKQNAKVGVALYRLTSGELQVNAPGGKDGKGPYSFTFVDCARDE